MSEPSVRSEFVEVYRRWFEAIGTHDSSFFERHLAPDWVYVDVRGAVREKRSYIEYMVKTPPTVRFEEVDVEVRRFGDVAVVHGTYFIDRSRAGLGPSTTTRFTSVWTYTDGRWQARTHHGTTVS
jgi:uncharacterized protein (TIGR02246 family)